MLSIDHMEYITYARKSSEAEDRQAASIEDQDKEIKILNSKLKLHVGYKFSESRSAKIPGRPEFNKMIELIERGGIKGILCWKLNRLARNAMDGGRIIWLVNEMGLEIVTPNKTYTKADQFLLYIEFGMANQFINDLSVDVKRGLKSKAEKGWLPSGAKSGYMNDKFAEKGSKTILPDPKYFPVIKQAWDMFLTGAYTVGQVLERLNGEWGYRTPIHKRIGGKPMHRSQMYKVFTDPFYYGEFEYPVKSNVWYQGQHKPMITREEFDRAQMLLGRPGRPRPHNRPFSYTGIIYCGECSSMITAEEKWQVVCSICRFKFSSKHRTSCPKCKTEIADMKSPTTRHYIYYRCTKCKNKLCTQSAIQEHELEKQITNLLSRIQISEKFKHWAIKYLNELNEQEVGTRNVAIQNNQDAYFEVIKRIDNLVALKISPNNTDGSLLNDEEFKSQKTTLMEEKERLSKRINGIDSRVEEWVELSEKTFNFAIHAPYWFNKADVERRKEIFQALGSNFLLQGGVLSLTLEKPFEIFEIIKKEAPEIIPTFEPQIQSNRTAHFDSLCLQNPSMLPRQDLNLEPCRYTCSLFFNKGWTISFPFIAELGIARLVSEPSLNQMCSDPRLWLRVLI